MTSIITSPSNNNNKLKIGSERVHTSDARYKYVFFMSPGAMNGKPQTLFDDVIVVSISLLS